MTPHLPKAFDMTSREACLKQIRWWNKALRDYQKAIKRKNKHINRLQKNNDELSSYQRELIMEIAELELSWGIKEEEE